MACVTIGIDPGLNGAVAIIDDQVKPPHITLHDTPTLLLTGRGTRRREYDVAAMAEILEPYSVWGSRAFETMVWIEATHAMPDQGVRSMWTMGYGAGLWEGMVAALRIPLGRVSPQRWQRRMLADLPRGKDAARMVASRLFPAVADQLRRAKDHGRADALLIAAWGRLGPLDRDL